jgi:hypothetical protein
MMNVLKPSAISIACTIGTWVLQCYAPSAFGLANAIFVTFCMCLVILYNISKKAT